MDIGECLDELRTNLLRDDSSQIAGDDDSYWSQPTLLRYINDAQRRFARRALCIRDDTTEVVCQVTLVAGQAIYVLHKSVLKVMSARHQDAALDMTRVTHPQSFGKINPAIESDQGWEAPIVAADTAQQPLEYATDEGTQVADQHQVRMLVRPTPSTDQAGKIINLRVIRMPLYELALGAQDDVEETPEENAASDAAAGTTQTPEIPEDWHIDMLEWAAYRAWRTYDGGADGEVDALKRAKMHKDRFEEAIAECRRETEMKMYQPPSFAFGQGPFAPYTK